MIPTIIRFLQVSNDPVKIIYIGFVYVASYYVVSAVFHHYSVKPGYSGIWRKNGIIDVITSVIWCIAAIGLITSLLDLLIRNELTVVYLLLYYALFLFLFAFLYNILNWHFVGTIDGLQAGWKGELQCVVMSIQVMTTGDYTSAKPAKLVAEVFACLQSLLGVLFVAVFIAKAVALLSASGAPSPP